MKSKGALMPELDENLLLCASLGILVIALFIFMSLPRKTILVEHCPFCFEEIPGRAKPGDIEYCPNCGRPIQRS
jgi:hypothetical protein